MPSISQLLQILGNANFSLTGCQANNWLGASGTKTSFTVRQFANLFRANRFFSSLLPTSVIRSLLVLHIINQHYAKCDLCSEFRVLWSVRAKYGCIVLSSLKNRSCCPSEFFFQWFYRTKGLADTEITKKQKNTLSLLIIFEWTLTIFDLSKVQSLGCPHRLIGFHTTIKNYNIAPPLGYLLTSLPTSNISLDFLYSSPALLVHLRRGSFSVTLKRLGQ